MRGVDMTWLFTLDDGRTRRWDMYLSLDAALEAARSGLRSAS